MKDEKKLIIEIAEPILDKALESSIKAVFGSFADVAKEEPCLGFAIALAQSPRTVVDAMFQYKIHKLLKDGKLSEKKLKRINNKLKGDKKERFWKLIFTSVQSHDDERRSALVGKVMTALSDDKISFDETMVMIHASNRINVDNLPQLLAYYQGRPGTIRPYMRQEFLTVGLMDQDTPPMTWGSSGGSTYPITDLGWKYLGAIFDYPYYEKNPRIKVGEDRLIGATEDESRSERVVMPFTEVKRQKYWYGEAAMIVRDKDKILMDDSGPVMESSPIYAGEYGERALSCLTGIDESKFTAVFLRNDKVRRVKVNYYVVKMQDVQKAELAPSAKWVSLVDLIRNSHEDAVRGLVDAIFKHDEMMKKRSDG